MRTNSTVDGIPRGNGRSGDTSSPSTCRGSSLSKVPPQTYCYEASSRCTKNSRRAAADGFADARDSISSRRCVAAIPSVLVSLLLCCLNTQQCRSAVATTAAAAPTERGVFGASAALAHSTRAYLLSLSTAPAAAAESTAAAAASTADAVAATAAAVRPAEASATTAAAPPPHTWRTAAAAALTGQATRAAATDQAAIIAAATGQPAAPAATGCAATAAAPHQAPRAAAAASAVLVPQIAAVRQNRATSATATAATAAPTPEAAAVDEETTRASAARIAKSAAATPAAAAAASTAAASAAEFHVETTGVSGARRAGAAGTTAALAGAATAAETRGASGRPAAPREGGETAGAATAARSVSAAARKILSALATTDVAQPAAVCAWGAAAAVYGGTKRGGAAALERFTAAAAAAAVSAAAALATRLFKGASAAAFRVSAAVPSGQSRRAYRTALNRSSVFHFFSPSSRYCSSFADRRQGRSTPAAAAPASPAAAPVAPSSSHAAAAAPPRGGGSVVSPKPRPLFSVPLTSPAGHLLSSIMSVSSSPHFSTSVIRRALSEAPGVCPAVTRAPAGASTSNRKKPGAATASSLLFSRRIAALVQQGLGRRAAATQQLQRPSSSSESGSSSKSSSESDVSALRQRLPAAAASSLDRTTAAPASEKSSSRTSGARSSSSSDNSSSSSTRTNSTAAEAAATGGGDREIEDAAAKEEETAAKGEETAPRGKEIKTEELTAAAASEGERSLGVALSTHTAGSPRERRQREVEEFLQQLKGQQQAQQQQPQQKEEGKADEKEHTISAPLASIMAWRCTGRSNDELVDRLYRAGVISNPRVYEAMKAVDRGNFVSSCPYVDSPQPLGIGSATISAPHMHAAALEELIDHMKPGNRVLDVGSGSGYLTVAMAYIVGVKGIKDEKAATAEEPEPEGVAIGIDYVPGLVKYSQDRVKKAYPRLMSNPHFQLVERDGWEGYSAAAPYDAIHVGAAAAAIPRRLVQQLKNGGKMVLPVEESLQGEILFEEEEDEGEKGSKKDEKGARAGLGRSTSAAEGAGRRRRSAGGEGDDESKRGVARASTTANSMWSRLFMGGGGQRFVAVTKDLQGNVHVKKLMGVMYVPLVKRKESLTIKHDE